MTGLTISRRSLILFGIATLGLCIGAAAGAADYPRISHLDQSDPYFGEQQKDVRAYYRQASTGGELPPLEFYEYDTGPEDTLFGIAARLSVPYSAIATLNRMTDTGLPGPGETILLPNIPGVFVPLDPQSDLEVVMDDLRHAEPGHVLAIERNGQQTLYRFYPGSDFLPDERSTFLGLMFRPPLRVLKVTSAFGPRHHPITGQWGFHAGVDLAAPRGTPVSAARSGTVADTGTDPTMGNYVLLQHSGGFTTFYGHLDTVAVTLNQPVKSGMIIGTVGSTGISTGFHLHFEIRQDNDPRDPMKLLPQGR